MNQPIEPPSIYQFRIVLREISPLIWRRLLVCSDTTLAHLHTMLQITFDWSDEHLHTFHVHGKDYGSTGADTAGLDPRFARVTEPGFISQLRQVSNT